MCKATDVKEVFEKFYNLYYKNKIAAKVECNSKKVYMSGKIQDIDSNRGLMYAEMWFDREAHGLFHDDIEHVKVHWLFDQTEINDIVKLRNGKNATLEGEFNTDLTQVWSRKIYVSHCRVVDCETE